MKSFLWLTGGTLGVFVIVRVIEARASGIPLDLAFKHPFTNTNELKAGIIAQSNAILQTLSQPKIVNPNVIS